MNLSMSNCVYSYYGTGSEECDEVCSVRRLADREIAFIIQTSPILTSGPRIFCVGRLMQASRLDVNGEPETRFGGGELKLVTMPSLERKCGDNSNAAPDQHNNP
jgi:hypothetical protein